MEYRGKGTHVLLVELEIVTAFWGRQSDNPIKIKNTLKKKYLPAMWETWVWSLGQEDPLEKEMATHSGILAWRIPWREKPGRLQSIGLQSQTWLRDYRMPRKISLRRWHLGRDLDGKMGWSRACREEEFLGWDLPVQEPWDGSLLVEFRNSKEACKAGAPRAREKWLEMRSERHQEPDHVGP